MSTPTQQEWYLKKLLEQGQDNLNICPSCFKNNKRAKLCTNPVVLLPEKVLVCCYLGARNEISSKQFEKKVSEMKALKKVSEMKAAKKN